MGRTYTLAEMRARVLDRVHLEKSKFIDTTRLNEYITTARDRLRELLYFADISWYEQVQVIPGDGTGSYALASDYYGLILVEVAGNSAAGSTIEPIVLKPYQIQRRAGIRRGRGAGRPEGYRLTNANIEVSPLMSASWELRVTYAPVAAKLTADDDTIDSVHGYEDLIILDAAIACRIREQNEIADLMAERRMVLDRIQEAAQQRQLADPGHWREVPNALNGGSELPQLDPADWRLWE